MAVEREAPEIMLLVRVVVGREGLELPDKGKRPVRENHAKVADASREKNPAAVERAPESVVEFLNPLRGVDGRHGVSPARRRCFAPERP